MKAAGVAVGLILIALVVSSLISSRADNDTSAEEAPDPGPVAVAPPSPDSQIGIAVMRLEEGDFSRAIYHAEAALSSDPDSTQKLRADSVLAEANLLRSARFREREQARAARENEIRAAIESRRDRIENVTWHHARGSKAWSNYAVYGYVGERASDYWMRLYLATRTSDWLFWDRVIFNVDGDIITFGPYESWDKKTDVLGRGVRESIDVRVDANVRRRLRRIADGNTVRVRFRGKYQRDWLLPAADKRRLIQILDFYDFVEGR